MAADDATGSEGVLLLLESASPCTRDMWPASSQRRRYDLVQRAHACGLIFACLRW